MAKKQEQLKWVRLTKSGFLFEEGGTFCKDGHCRPFDADATGTTIPFLTNITYRIETNMGPALNYANRPSLNPTDSFYTVSMKDPRGSPVPLLYDGNAGNPRTVILPFDTQPFFMTSPYDSKNMGDWDHSARNARGEQLYPEGTYTVTAQVNLNGMQAAYRDSGMDIAGKLTGTGSVSLEGKVLASATTGMVTPGVNVTTVSGTASPTQPVTTQSSATTPVTTHATSAPVPKRTTYSPVPAWLPIIGLAGAGLVLMKRR